MKLLFRFLIPLAVALAVLAYALVPLIYDLTQRWFVRDLDIRSRLILNSIQESVSPLLDAGPLQNQNKIVQLLKKATQDERLLAVGFCTLDEKLVLKTDLFPSSISCSDVRNLEPHSGIVRKSEKGDLHISYGFVIKDEQKPVGKILFVHDMSFVSRRSEDTRNYLFIVFLIIAVVTSAITIFVARWSQASWLSKVQDLVTGIRHKQIDSSNTGQEFRPILKDLKRLVRDLQQSENSRDDSLMNWDAKALKEILGKELSGEEVLVVSNREPYIHNFKSGKIELQVPASGLVTAVEPILRACSGILIAHGSGSADRNFVDRFDRVKVPPENPKYEIHRVWLTKEEEAGYYYGFANEGLWPLCHIAHHRPIFRKSDWEKYVEVNKKFADAVLKDVKQKDPVILVQDYHFALLPKLLREQLPDATIIAFWHIPWPNPESFGICPWRKEILDGLLGSSILGFHTQYHCNNFLDSIDRFLEARIDRETHAVSYMGNLSFIKPYPISIEWPPQKLDEVPGASECRQKICEQFNLPSDIQIGIGVDRLDYTKGILERFLAIERLFELNPSWIGRFAFIQIAAPSRSSIAAYQEFQSEVRGLTERINSRFGIDGFKPIHLIVEHHEPQEVFRFLRAVNICIVSSLHDGMNLVAKEFIAARDEGTGVLILSMFTGASRELMEALIINPYDIEQTAKAILKAITMPLSEQRERMQVLRSIVREFNVFRWAGRMLLDASIIRRRQKLKGMLI